MATKLLKFHDVASRVTGSRSSIYARIKAGTLPPPIRISSQSAAWVEHEIEAVLRAQIAGKSGEDLKNIVSDLVRQRQQAA